MKKRFIREAATPPIMTDEVRKPPPKFINRNGLLQDPLQIQKQTLMMNIWTEAEKEIFTEKFLKQPKNFHFTASFLKHKSVAECVSFYYHNKKKENYKKELARLKLLNKRKKNKTKLKRTNCSST